MDAFPFSKHGRLEVDIKRVVNLGVGFACPQPPVTVIVDSDGALAGLVHFEVAREHSCFAPPLDRHVHLLRLLAPQVMPCGCEARMLHLDVGGDGTLWHR
jgi:hypothetical protein